LREGVIAKVDDIGVLVVEGLQKKLISKHSKLKKRHGREGTHRKVNFSHRIIKRRPSCQSSTETDPNQHKRYVEHLFCRADCANPKKDESMSSSFEEEGDDEPLKEDYDIGEECLVFSGPRLCHAKVLMALRGC